MHKNGAPREAERRFYDAMSVYSATLRVAEKVLGLPTA